MPSALGYILLKMSLQLFRTMLERAFPVIPSAAKELSGIFCMSVSLSFRAQRRISQAYSARPAHLVIFGRGFSCSFCFIEGCRYIVNTV